MKSLQASNFEEGGWTHLVVTVSGSTLKTYKDGVLANTNTEAWEPNVITRTQHWLGQSGRSTDGHFKGTIAKLKIWHNKELSPEEINALPKLPCFPGTYGFGYPDCQVCAAGSFSTLVDATQCSSCPIGKFLSDDGVDAAKHDHLEDCDVCEAGKYNDDDATDPSLHASCTICLDGKYNADAGTSAANHIKCTSCPAGKKNDKVGATNHNGADDCDLCSPGTVSQNSSFQIHHNTTTTNAARYARTVRRTPRLCDLCNLPRGPVERIWSHKLRRMSRGLRLHVRRSSGSLPLRRV